MPGKSGLTGGEAFSILKRTTAGKNTDVYLIDDYSHRGLPVPDYCGVVAKREGGGPGWRVRRHGVADGIRTARIGDAAFQGHHGIGGDFHVHVDGAFHHGDEERRIGDDGFGGRAAEIGSREEAGTGADTGAARSGEPASTHKEVGPRNAEVAELADALA